MKKLSLVLAFGSIVLGLSAVEASSATRKFIGGGTITAVTAACVGEGWAAGNVFSASYRPQNLSGNPSTSLGMFFNYGAMNFTLATGSAVGTTYRPVTGTAMFGLLYTMPSPKMRFTTQAPSAPLTATSVYIVGNIQNFDVTGCTITFKASLVAFP